MKPAREEARATSAGHLGRPPRRRPGPGGVRDVLAGATDERGLIVAWLRSEATTARLYIDRMTLRGCADAIERGAHLAVDE